MNAIRSVKTPETGVEAKAKETPKGGACTSLAPGHPATNAAGTSAGAGPAVARTTAKTKTNKSQVKQRTSALTGTSTDPSKTQAGTTATVNTTAGPTLATRTPVPGNTGTVKRPPTPTAPPTSSHCAATTGQTESASHTEDAFSRVWKVVGKRGKGKGKGNQQARCPYTGPSGPPAASAQCSRPTRKERRQARKMQGKGKGNPNKHDPAASSVKPISGKLNFSTGERSKAVAGTSRLAPGSPSAHEGLAVGTIAPQRPEGKDQTAAKRALNETLAPRGDHKQEYNISQPPPEFKIKIHKCHFPVNLNCSCTEIERVVFTKYLGIMVDQRLSWHNHTELIMKRIRKLIWTFKTLRHVTSKKLLLQIYISLAQSVLTYCLPVWGGATKIKFLDLERAQRSLLKVMFFKPFRFSTENLYRTSDLLTVRKLYVLHIILTKHKTLSFNPQKIKGRRKNTVAPTVSVKSTFAKRQYPRQSSHLYNLLNKVLDIYLLTYRECKKALSKWLKSKTYDEVENMVQSMIL